MNRVHASRMCLRDATTRSNIDNVTLTIGIVVYQSNLEHLRNLFISLSRAIEQLEETRSAKAKLYLIVNEEWHRNSAAQRHELQNLMKQELVGLDHEMIAGHGNIGYGTGQNRALNQATSDFHLILNPDVVLEDFALRESVDFLEHQKDAVMVVPHGIDARGEYATLAKRSPSVLALLFRAFAIKPSDRLTGRIVGSYVYSDKLPSATPVCIDHASGCFMFCRTAALKQISGFDPAYFLYFEDYDLSRRIRQLGTIWELPTVKIRHMGGRTAQRGIKRITYFLRSAVRFFQQYGWRIV